MVPISTIRPSSQTSNFSCAEPNANELKQRTLIGHGLVHISEDVLPQMVNPTRATRSSSLNSISFRPRKCKTVTYLPAFIFRARYENLECFTSKLEDEGHQFKSVQNATSSLLFTRPTNVL